MIKTIRTMPVKFRTDRDAEYPILTEFVKARAGKFKSVLDIGAHFSHATYAKEIRKYAKKYDAIDIKFDPETAKITDNFYTGNANTYPLKKYDMVICVGVIEHAGISTYKADYKQEQDNLFLTCLRLAKKYIWISVDCGSAHYYPDEWAKITLEQWKKWKTFLKHYNVKCRYLYTNWAQGGHPWHEVEEEEFVFSIPYTNEIGNQTIAILEINKNI